MLNWSHRFTLKNGSNWASLEKSALLKNLFKNDMLSYISSFFKVCCRWVHLQYSFSWVYKRFSIFLFKLIGKFQNLKSATIFIHKTWHIDLSFQEVMPKKVRVRGHPSSCLRSKTTSSNRFQAFTKFTHLVAPSFMGHKVPNVFTLIWTNWEHHSHSHKNKLHLPNIFLNKNKNFEKSKMHRRKNVKY